MSEEIYQQGLARLEARPSSRAGVVYKQVYAPVGYQGYGMVTLTALRFVGTFRFMRHQIANVEASEILGELNQQLITG